jgi:hypothetical protein
MMTSGEFREIVTILIIGSILILAINILKKLTKD